MKVITLLSCFLFRFVTGQDQAVGCVAVEKHSLHQEGQRDMLFNEFFDTSLINPHVGGG